MRALTVIVLLSFLLIPTVHGTTVEIGTTPKLVFDADTGALAGEGGFVVADLDDAGTWLPARGPVSTTDGGLAFSGAAPDLDMQVEAVFAAPADGVIEATITLSETTGRDRGGSVRFAVPVPARNLSWWQDLDTARPVEQRQLYRSVQGMRAFPTLPFEPDDVIPGTGEFSPWFMGCVTNGQMGLAMARRPDRPCISRFSYDADQGLLMAEYDAGLSPAMAKSPQRATFHMVLFSFDGRLGMRGAFARYYELFPAAFQNRAQAHGQWLPFNQLRNFQDVDEFGIQYHESGREHSFDAKIGVDSSVYMFPSRFYAMSRPAPEGATPDELIDVAERSFRAYGGEAGNRVRLSIIHDVDGNPVISPHGSGISGQANVAPDLPLSAYYDGVIDRYLSSGATNGVYYDGLPGGMNYRREHLAHAQYPAMYDAVSKKVGLLNLFTGIEWAEKVWDDVGRLAQRGNPHTFANNSAMDTNSLYAYTMDVMGAEMGIGIRPETMANMRAASYQKPFCALLKGDFNTYSPEQLEHYTKRLLAFGHAVGMFDITPSSANPGSSYWEHPEWHDRDRQMHRQYLPLLRDLGAAGWEPVSWVEHGSDVIVNRFGHLDDGQLFITVLNDEPAEAHLNLALDVERLGLDTDAAIFWEEIRGEPLAAQREAEAVAVRLVVPGRDVAVIRVARAETMAAARLQRVAQLAEARQNYAKAVAEYDQLSRWPELEGGYVVDHQVALHGAASIRCDSGEQPSGARAVTQVINQREPKPLHVLAHARFEGVPETEYEKVTVQVELVGTQSGNEATDTLHFTGEGQWLEAEAVLRPEFAVRHANVTLSNAASQGRVWFDEASLLEDGCQVNRLRCPSFETGLLSPELEQQVSGLLETMAQRTRAAADEVGAPKSALGQIAELRTRLAELADLVSAEQLAPAAGRLLRDVRDIEQQLDMATVHLTGAGPLQMEFEGVLAPGTTTPVHLSVVGEPLDNLQYHLTAEGCTVSGADRIDVPGDLSVGTLVMVRATASGAWQGTPVLLHTQQTVALSRPFDANIALRGISEDNRIYSYVLALTNHTHQPLTLHLHSEPPGGAHVEMPPTVQVPPDQTLQQPVELTFGVDAFGGPVEFSLQATATGQPPVDLAHGFTFMADQPNLVRNPGFEDMSEGRAVRWTVYGEQGYEIDTAVKHGGEASIRCDLPERGVAGALQGVAVNQTVRCPVIVGGFSRADDVRAQYAMYADVHYRSGDKTARRANFSPGTHDWEYTEVMIEATEPIRSINLHCLLRWGTGRAWFDNVFVYEDPSRKDNLLATGRVEVTTSSSSGTYTPAPLTDGLGYPPDDMHWADMAWASVTAPEEHWIQMRFQQPTQVGRVHIFWNKEKGRLCTSHSYEIQAHDGNDWQTLLQVSQDDVKRLSVHRFEPVTTESLRILQHVGGGPVFRPNIMWVSEVEAFAD